jgi:hypothetical protein
MGVFSTFEGVFVKSHVAELLVSFEDKLLGDQRANKKNSTNCINRLAKRYDRTKTSGPLCCTVQGFEKAPCII